MTDTFETQMAKIAKHVADKAVNKDTPFAESLDAFKSLTTYYGLLLKHKSAPEDDPDAPNFDNFGKQFGEEPPDDSGHSKVRAGRRNGTDAARG